MSDKQLEILELMVEERYGAELGVIIIEVKYHSLWYNANVHFAFTPVRESSVWLKSPSC